MKVYSSLFAFALILLLAPACRAQSADMPRHGTSLTGLNDPEPAEPRYLATNKLRQLKEEQSAAQPTQAQPALDQPTPPQKPAPNGLPDSSMSLRKP